MVVVAATLASGGDKKKHNPCDDTDDVDFVKSNRDDAKILADKLGVPFQWVLAPSCSSQRKPIRNISHGAEG